MPAKKKIVKKTAPQKTAQTKAKVSRVKSENRNVFYFFAAIILGFGIFLSIPALSSTNTKTTNEVADIIAFDGQDNVTALNVLKQTHKVETISTSYGDFITSIDGKSPNSNQFWSFYVNGEMASEGAGTYVTKSTDRIIFRLQNIE